MSLNLQRTATITWQVGTENKSVFKFHFPLSCAFLHGANLKPDLKIITCTCYYGRYIGVVHEHLWLPLSPLISSVPTASGQPEPPEDPGVQRACAGHRSPECQGPLQEGPRLLQPAQVREGPRGIRDSGQSR